MLQSAVMGQSKRPITLTLPVAIYSIHEDDENVATTTPSTLTSLTEPHILNLD